MVDKLDPHHLVALMSYLLKGKQEGSCRALNLISANPEYSISKGCEMDECTFHILDAIAVTNQN